MMPNDPTKCHQPAHTINLCRVQRLYKTNQQQTTTMNNMDKKSFHQVDDEDLTDTDITLSESFDYSSSDEEEDIRVMTWRMWQIRFSKSTENLLADTVDLDTQRHMSLEPLLTVRARKAQESALRRNSPISLEYWLGKKQQDVVEAVAQADKTRTRRRRRKGKRVDDQAMRSLIQKVARM